MVRRLESEVDDAEVKTEAERGEAGGIDEALDSVWG